MNTCRIASALVVVVGVFLPAVAEDGNIPVYASRVITAPGHYVVTRDISSSTTDVITIQASDVTLDLNGHVLSTTGYQFSPIKLQNAGRVTIVNGRASSGWDSITGNCVSLTLASVTLVSSGAVGVNVSGLAYVDVSKVRVEANSYQCLKLAGAYSGRVVDNVLECVDANHLFLNGMSRGIVRGNVITGSGTLPGILLSGTGGANLIEGNVIDNVHATGIYVGASQAGNIIRDNTVRRGMPYDSAYGIEIYSSDNLVTQNVFSSNFHSGIYVTGSRNRIESNLSQGSNFFGIQFTAGSSGNMYRDNMLRGNASAPVGDLGTGNTDGGGNVF